MAARFLFRNLDNLEPTDDHQSRLMIKHIENFTQIQTNRDRFDTEKYQIYKYRETASLFNVNTNVILNKVKDQTTKSAG